MTKTEILLMIATASTTLCGVSWLNKLKDMVDKPPSDSNISKKATTVSNQPKGFIDYKTGRRVDIDPETGKEYFLDTGELV
ncbi:hypothetical protein [Streptococcus sp. E17BB]|uniref:hypothetical protein n=1 Tax=Streptococcus sp. E17BB TaxID=3278714 RepID=UPI00359E4B25